MYNFVRDISETAGVKQIIHIFFVISIIVARFEVILIKCSIRGLALK